MELNVTLTKEEARALLAATRTMLYNLDQRKNPEAFDSLQSGFEKILLEFEKHTQVVH
jgi:hypothetical protein